MFEESLLLTFIKTIDGHLFDDLYSYPFTCFVIFRELPSLSKHIISRVLFIDETIRMSLISSWVNKDKLDLLKKVMQDLSVLRIFCSALNGPQGECWRLNRRFQENLKYSMFGGKNCDMIVESSGQKAEKPESLLLVAVNKWEAILSVVAECKKTVDPSSIIYKVISNANYLNKQGITNEGFQFLLLQKKKQVWKFLICYLEYMKRKSNITEVLHTLCHMGFGIVDQQYTFSRPTDLQLEMLQHFVEFGFVDTLHKLIRRDKCIFQPTQLLVDLIYGYNKQSFCPKNDQINVSVIDSQGYIIMESSDLIYATTSSKLQTAVLNMFCEIRQSFDGGIICHITDKTIYGALEKGITSEQIIEFLKNNAHPEMKNKTIVPITLMDKLKMAEFNHNRTRASQGCLYYDFSSYNEYEVLVEHTEKTGVLLWKNSDKQLVIVTEDSHQQIKKFWKNRKG